MLYISAITIKNYQHFYKSKYRNLNISTEFIYRQRYNLPCLISEDVVISVRWRSEKANRDFKWSPVRVIKMVTRFLRKKMKKNKTYKQRGTSLRVQLWLSPLFVACLTALKQREYFACCLWAFLCNRKTHSSVLRCVVHDIRRVNPRPRSVNHHLNWRTQSKPHVNN